MSECRRFVERITNSAQANTSTVWVKKIPPAVFWYFFPNGWEFLINFLLTYYVILCTLDYKFLFNYLQPWRSYAILSATTGRIFTFHYNFNFYVCLLSKWRHWWRHAISYMFIDIINNYNYKIVYFIVTCHRQGSTKLSTTYANVGTRAFRLMVDILSILCELGSRA